MLVKQTFKAPLLLMLAVYWACISAVILHGKGNLFAVKLDNAIDQVDVLIDSTPGYSAEEFDLRQTQAKLPHDWHTDGINSTVVWYRTSFNTDGETKQPWAIFIPSVTHNAEIYINGTWVGHGSAPTEPVPRHHHRPLYFEFSSSLLKPFNEVAIRVEAAHARQGLLAPFYIAPSQQLIATYEQHNLWKVELIKWMTAVMLLTAFIIFWFWLARPKDKIYGLFAAMLFIWAVHNLNLMLVHIPFSVQIWESLTMATLGWTVVLMIYFNHNYVGNPVILVERAALLFAVAGLGIFFLPDLNQVLQIGYLIWDSFLIIFGSYALCHLGYVFWHRRDLDVYLMMLAGIPMLIFGLHDILIVNHLRDRSEGLIIQYSAIPAMALFTWFLIRRFVSSINEFEQLNSQLETRVQNREQQLEHQYQKLRTLENKQILSKERERIMRDMHDGIGGQLLSLHTFAASHEHEHSQLFRQKISVCLSDLRMVIDSLDPTLANVATLLGNLRNRLESQLQGTGVKLLWNIKNLPEDMHHSPRQSLHFMRIIQEAVNNAIKHSATESLEFEADIDPHQQLFYVAIKDQGGKDPSKNTTGRGLANMSYRAGQIGARCQVTLSPAGSCVRLEFPLSEQKPVITQIAGQP
ncbi:sensor histidine kinase [Reinekea blandensis]|uniref:Probable two component sensor histidine kinase transcription regulator protein n=1 Tax=Reinekea blandensis MED297 TaxID=314283 RepID=A4BHY1_9GAMM|nr:hypothetical protein [Reinekea blandensis]EAR08253.1 probable two component sensor histidine kinase transcription regulator protein [Reinekea sp. MED297] [Reinekea blandensis MED297]